MAANTNTTGIDTAALLREAASVPTHITLTESNPLENVPAFSFGKEIQKGAVVAGYYEGGKTVEGKHGPSQLHTLRLAKSGNKIALRGKAGINLFFSKRQIGEFVKITYTGLGVNEEGNDQHFFDFEVGTNY